jgi:hypothetical protein
MPRRPARVTQADIARALRAATAEGGAWRIEIRPDGVIVLTPAAPDPAPAEAAPSFARGLKVVL